MIRSDEKKITQFQSKATQPVKIKLMTDESPFSQEIVFFAEKLKTLSPCIEIKKEPIGMGEYPGLYVGTGLSCHFLPSGPKLNGFLESLSWLNSPELSDPPSEISLFGDLNLPADIRLYVAEGCPHCPKVFSQLLPLPFVNSKIRLWIFDPLFFPKMAQEDAVRAVPTTIIDRSLRWSGAIDLPELARVITSRDPAMLSAGSLDMLLKEGNAQRLVEMFQSSGKIYPAFLELLTHPAWSTRLGAMVVMETLIESAPSLAAQIQPSIWEQFENTSDSVKGDLLYIIGELRRKENIAILKAIADGKYSEEVKEAADEALAKMRKL